MSGDNGKNMKEMGKNFLIVVLVAVVAVQAALLFSKSRSEFMEKGPAAYEDNKTQTTTPEAQNASGFMPPKKIAVAETAVDSAKGEFVLVAFDQPVVEKSAVGKKPDKLPGSFSPHVSGDWEWVSPVMLRFNAQDHFDREELYTLTLFPEKILGEGGAIASADNLVLKMQDFKIEDIDLDTAPSSGNPGFVEVHGDVKFSLDIDPEAALDHVRLEVTGADNGTVALLPERLYNSRYFYFQSDPKTPIQKTMEPRKITLVVEESLPAANSNYTLGQSSEKSISIVFDRKLSVERRRGRVTKDKGTLVLELSSAVNAQAAKKYVRVDPTMEFTTSTDGDDLLLSGGFEPGKTYTVHMEKGLPALDGAKLMEAKTYKIHMPDLNPSLTFDDTGVFLSKNGLKNIAFTSVNTNKAQVRIDRIYRNNIYYLLTDYSSGILLNDNYRSHSLARYLGDRVYSKDFELDTPWNDPKQFTINTEEFFPDEPGLYRVLLSEPNEWQASQRFVLVTDLGIVAKRGVDDLLVWVASYDDLEVQSDVSVKLLSYQNQTLAEGETDENGVVHFTDLGEEFDEHSPFLIYAEKGDDLSFLVFNEFGIDTTGLDVGGVAPSNAGYMGYIYGERDIYRPGETVEGAAILRQADLTTPPSMPLTLKWIDPRGRHMASVSLEMNEEGMAPYSFDVPAYALTGSHTLELTVAEDVVATYEFKVEEFMPDRIKVDINPESGEPQPGEEFTYTVDSKYFFGPPASGLAVETRVQLMAATFSPKGYEAYSFTDPNKSFDDVELISEEGVLNDNGTAQFKFTVPEGLTPPSALAARVVSRVSERGGRGVSSMQQVPAHAYPRYPGLKSLGRNGYDPGSEITFEYVVLAPDGQKTDGQQMVAELYKNHWQTVLRRTPSGSFRYYSEREPELLMTKEVADASSGTFTMVPPQYGSYSVVLRDASGAASQVDFYAGGWGYSPWAVENAARIELEPDKTEYSPGETASVQVRAPFSGKLLVTVEGGSVHHVASYAMDGNTAQVEFPIKEEYGPNVYISAVLVRSAEATEPGKVSRAYGAAPIFVNRGVNHAPVSIYAPDTVRPKTSMEVTVQTEPGAMVTLAAVDEGILSLISQESPDPFSHFYAKRKLQVESYDTFAMLFPEVEGVSPIGGGALAKALSKFVNTDSLRRVKPVAFWFEPVQADEDGNVIFELDVPEFQGALRFMAVAVKGKHFGSADAQTKVRSPIVITPTLPRFMALDDEIQVPVAVRNDTPGDGEFTVSFNVSGPAEVDESEIVLDIPKGKEELAVFTLRATGEGIVSANFTAAGNEEQIESNVELPVRSALPPKTVTDSGVLTEQRKVFPAVDVETFREEDLVREVFIGPSPMVRFTRSLKYALRYPYGCVEQTTTRSFPLLYIADVAAKLDQDLDTRGVPNFIQAGIQRLQSMQVSSGGFSFWPGGHNAYSFGSFYATHFLVEASQAGYSDAEYGLDQALDYMGEKVRDYLDDGDKHLRQMCYGLYVLALAGRPDKGSMDHIRSYFGSELSSLTGSLLGAAYALTGDREALEQLMGGHWEKKEDGSYKTETGGFLSSSLRDTALQLAVLQRQLPDDPRVVDLVQELVRKLEADRYISTQETAWSMIALGQFYRSIADEPPFQGSLLVDGEEVARFSSDETLSLTGDKAIQGFKELEIVMDEGFTGPLFYTIRTIGIPQDAAYKPYAQGLEIKRTFYDREGAVLDKENLQQGDLVVLKLDIRSKNAGRVQNVAMLNMLPAGLEVENPRLESTESLPWLDEKSDDADYLDLRDDRVIFFLDLPRSHKQTMYVLLRAVTAGAFKLPPVLAEAMYDPQIAAGTEYGALMVLSDLPETAVRTNERKAEGENTESPESQSQPSGNAKNSTSDAVNATAGEATESMQTMRKTFRLLVYCIPVILVMAGIAFFLLDAFFQFPFNALRYDPAVMVRASDGTPMRIFLPYDGRRRFPLELEEVSPVFRKVILSSEDRYFQYHPGVNPGSILRAAVQNVIKGRVVSGGSTITMQLARLAEPKSRSFKAKIIEAFRALQLEYSLSKSEIFKQYLNHTPYGGNVVGVGAAAYTYFGKSANALSLGEAALLAVLPRAPQAYDPIKNPATARAARDRLLDTLQERNVFTTGQVALAKKQPLPTALTAAPMIAPHASRMVYQQLKEAGMAGLPRIRRENLWELKTTLSIAAQHETLAAVKRRLPALRRIGLDNAAVVVMDRATREVRALVGTDDFFDTEHHGPINAALAKRSPGSTLKPFLYGLAFDAGIVAPGSILLDIPTDFSGYTPSNYDNVFSGPVTVREALVNSLNAPVVRLLARLGVPRFHHLLQRGGIELRHAPEYYGLPLALGACEATLLQLTTLYAALAEGGIWKPARLLAEDQRAPALENMASSVRPSVRLLSREAAYLVRSILENVPRRDLPGTWSMTLNAPEIAWKTGTSFGHRDSWAIGISANYVVGVWAGNLDGRAAKGISGAQHAGPLLFDVIRAVEQPGAILHKPEGLNLGTATVCAESRDLPSQYTPQTTEITIIPGVTRLERSTLHRQIFVDPDTGMRLEGRCLSEFRAEPRVVRTPPDELVGWELARGIPVQTLPPLLPACDIVPKHGGPAIISPSEVTPYVLRSDAPAEYQQIPLKARTDGSDGMLYWFQDGVLVARGSDNEQLFLTAQRGEHQLVVQDSQGRSDSLTFTVEQSEQIAQGCWQALSDEQRDGPGEAADRHPDLQHEPA
eukprot:TRINITY_DN6581_c0_g1_i1.p1 TRINITY_DN6581_c0_g1~~TRINITY_DN6581_c0_g1_i1.p1  ORF type:complete len:2719 (+),score=536.27 TRINITY_DN6581_c0_g1_i1:30620-38776(+)